MGRRAEDIARLWMNGDQFNEWVGDCLVIRNGGLTHNHRWRTPISQKMKTPGFFAVNIDAIYDTRHTYNASIRTLQQLGISAVPLSFTAAGEAGVVISETELLYKDPVMAPHCYSSERNPRSLMLCFGRKFMTLQDEYWRGIIEIENDATTWDEAHWLLKPKAVRSWEKETGFAARRQGEWHLIPRPELKIPSSKLEKWKYMPHGTHLATQYAEIDGKIYIRGTLRHRPDAITRRSWYNKYCRNWIRMGDYWHEAHMANFVESYG